LGAELAEFVSIIFLEILTGSAAPIDFQLLVTKCAQGDVADKQWRAHFPSRARAKISAAASENERVLNINNFSQLNS